VGSPIGAVFYVTTNGVSEESSYPYKGKFGACQSKTIPPVLWNSNAAYSGNLGGNEEILKMVLIRHGPVIVAVGK
jgi:hypothetical protein